jgi:hypothetical protein
MHILPDVTKAIQEDKLRAAARHQLQDQAHAARRARHQDGPVRRLAHLRVLRFLRVRRVAQAY